MDPQSAYFADPDPGSQNLADLLDPDPKHCQYNNPEKVSEEK